MIAVLLLQLIVNGHTQSCGGIGLTNLNPQAPSRSNQFRIPTSVTNLEFCKNLNNQPGCCTVNGYERMKEKQEKFYQNLQKSNFEYVLNMNDMMVEALRYRNNITLLADYMNSLFEQVDEQSEEIETTIQDVQEILNDTTTNSTGDSINTNSVVNLSNIPLPQQLEQYRKDIKRYQDLINNQLDDVDEYVNRLQNFDAFENSTFYYKIERGTYRFNMTAIEQQFESIQIAMRHYVKRAEECFPTLLAHNAGLKCLTCDAFNQNSFGSYGLGSKFYFLAQPEICVTLNSKCFSYLESQELMNQIVDMYVLAEMSKQYKNSADLEIEEAMIFLLELQDVAYNTLEGQFYFRYPNGCTSQQDCNYLCDRWLQSMTVDLVQVFQANFYSSSFMAANQFRVNISQLSEDLEDIYDDDFEGYTPVQNTQNQSNRVLQGNSSTVYVDFSDPNNPTYLNITSPEDQAKDIIMNSSEVTQSAFEIFMSPENDEVTMFYNQIPLVAKNSIDYGKTTGAELNFDGTSGLNIFNLSGKATEADLLSYQVMLPHQTHIKIVDTNQSQVLMAIGLAMLLFI